MSLICTVFFPCVDNRIQAVLCIRVAQQKELETSLGWLVWHELSHVTPALVSRDTLISGNFSTMVVMLRQGRCDETQEPLDLLQRLVPRLSSWDMFRHIRKVQEGKD